MNQESTVWTPNPKQSLFLAIPDTVDEALFGGAAGAGKSELLMIFPIVRGWISHPRFKGILFRRTYPELEKEIIVRADPYYRAAGGDYSSDKKRWKFKSGAIIQFGHMEYEQDVRKYDTAEYNYAGFDELTSFTQFQYIYFIKSRVRSSVASLPAISRAGTNPGNVGHTWVKERFIDPVPYGTIIKETVKNRDGVSFSTKRIFIQALLSDNKKNLGSTYEANLLGLPDAERRAKLYGDWDSFEGQVFTEWRSERRDNEPENALHVIKPFSIPDWWLKIRVTDWGYNAMQCTLWLAISPNNRVFVYREYTCKKTPISEWGKKIKELSGEEVYADVVLCKSAWQNRGEESGTIAIQFEKATGTVPREADNDRITGKQLVEEYLRWKPLPDSEYDEYSEKKAFEILSSRGIEAYHKYEKSFQEKKGETLPKVQVFDTCTELINAIPKCIYAGKSNTTEKPSEDVKEFDGDDPYDTFRYGLMAVQSFIDRLLPEEDYRSKIEKAVQELKRTGNQTSYYRRMEFIEAKGPATVEPVRRGSVYKRKRVA